MGRPILTLLYTALAFFARAKKRYEPIAVSVNKGLVRICAAIELVGNIILLTFLPYLEMAALRISSSVFRHTPPLMIIRTWKAKRHGTYQFSLFDSELTPPLESHHVDRVSQRCLVCTGVECLQCVRRKSLTHTVGQTRSRTDVTPLSLSRKIRVAPFPRAAGYRSKHGTFELRSRLHSVLEYV